MKTNWRLFFLVEGLLLLLALYQLVNNTIILVVFILGIVCLYKGANATKPKRKIRFLIGIALLAFALMSISAFWFMLITAVAFFSLKGKLFFSKADSFHFDHAPWNEKEMIVVETTESLPKNGKTVKQKWFGNERIGSTIYEWDDINFSLFMGDTIIDLGNTLLPKEDSYIVIRKGIGKTRVLVPSGIGTMIEFSTVKGKLSFENRQYELNNESVKLFAEDYDEQARKLKILINTFIGDVEVVTI